MKYKNEQTFKFRKNINQKLNEKANTKFKRGKANIVAKAKYIKKTPINYIKTKNFKKDWKKKPFLNKVKIQKQKRLRLIIRLNKTKILKKKKKRIKSWWYIDRTTKQIKRRKVAKYKFKDKKKRKRKKKIKTRIKKSQIYDLWHQYHKNFFGSLILRGRKIFAFNFFQTLKSELKRREQQDPFLLFLISMIKLTPKVFLRHSWFSGTTKGIPLPIRLKKIATFTVLWTIRLLRKRDRCVKIHFLCDLLIGALYSRGEAYRKKQEYHKMACNNRYLLRFLK